MTKSIAREEKGCYHKGCSLLRVIVDNGAREVRVGHLDPPFTFSDEDGGESVEHYCICLTTPTKGRIRLLTNGIPDSQAYREALLVTERHWTGRDLATGLPKPEGGHLTERDDPAQAEKLMGFPADWAALDAEAFDAKEPA
jgi:hypothetical protein